MVIKPHSVLKFQAQFMKKSAIINTYSRGDISMAELETKQKTVTKINDKYVLDLYENKIQYY